MRRKWTKGQTGWRRTLFACGLAVLLALQGLSSPLALAATAPTSQGDGVVANLATLGAWCAHDADDASGGGADHAHSNCCVMCQSGARDTAAVLAFVVVAIGVDPFREAAAPPVPADADDIPPRMIGWASSWSSRAPPFFS
ncbi:hypothetical protein [Methylocystis echinoides]|uniref:DUF2946 domain-containing protein n=1 Tax=Methylocystis echinoides TaxID=29468 RepID=A0A9W6GRV9_9HYPH|nr:hypothetical protein [Methylocystis echinoides]GLI91756.1 hypothetical protein LMG27198_07480 [Methylocystis echinoides]